MFTDRSLKLPTAVIPDELVTLPPPLVQVTTQTISPAAFPEGIVIDQVPVWLTTNDAPTREGVVATVPDPLTPIPPAAV
jgi:hypothetical protein